MKWRLAILAAFVTAASASVFASNEQDMSAQIRVSDLQRLATVDPRYQSYNVEMAEIVGGRFWAPLPPPGTPINRAALFRQRPPADLASARLRNLARGLGPAYVRVSGSWANTTYFQDDDLPPAKPPQGYQNVVTRKQWAGVIAFARATDARIVTSFAVGQGPRDTNGAWMPDQARKFLRFTRKMGASIYAAELINEPNLGSVSGLPSGYSAHDFARDSAIFKAFVSREFPGMKIVGPGSSGEAGVSMFGNSGLSSDAMLAAAPKARFDVFSYHFYGARSARCPGGGIAAEAALGEEWLARTDTAFAFYKALRDRYAPKAPIWLNETAQASCGGDRIASSFLDSFRYVDQMGRLARQGVAAVFHNTLAASDYGLIDEATLSPRPNYWAALMWRRLMGQGVLDAGSARPGLHLYAHCLQGQSGGVAMVALNLDRTASVPLSVQQASQRYTLSSDDLLGSATRLNGQPLELVGDKLPQIKPANQAAGAMTLGPASITFLAFPNARSRACR